MALMRCRIRFVEQGVISSMSLILVECLLLEQKSRLLSEQAMLSQSIDVSSSRCRGMNVTGRLNHHKMI